MPVEKARAQQVFEDIARRRVDPGLLQTTIGNNYELRIYPLLPGRTRTVELRIVEPAPSRLRIPLAYAERVRQFAVSLRVPAAKSAPELSGPAALGLRFERDPSGGFVARSVREDAVAAERARRAQGGLGAATARPSRPRNSPASATSRSSCRCRSAPRRGRCRIGCRSSGTLRARARTGASTASSPSSIPTSPRCATRASRSFASPMSPRRRSASRSARGDWAALRHALETTVYDGASNLGAVRHDGVSREALWFSDGLANYGAPWRLAFPVPVYAISSADSGDPAALQALADATGGRSIDLATMTREAAVGALLRRGSALAGLSALGARELVAQSQSAAAGRLVVAGVLSAEAAEVTLRVRDASGAVTTRVVPIHAGRNPSQLAALQWARLTLASLEGEARTNKVRIREIGKRFGLATRETSLLVLEQVDDYVRNDIEPPAELRAGL